MGCGNSSKKIDTPLIKKEEPRIKAPEEVKDAEDLNYKELAQLQEIIFGKADVEKARQFLISSQDAQNCQFKLTYASKKQLESFPPIVCPGNMVTYIYLNFGQNEFLDGSTLNKYFVALKNCKQLFGFQITLGGPKVNDLCANLLSQFFVSNALFKVLSLDFQECGITDKGMIQIIKALRQERFIEVFKIKVTNCKRISKRSWSKLPELLDTFGKMKIYKAEHDKIKKETKPTKRNWQFNKMAQHYVLKKQKTKKKQ